MLPRHSQKSLQGKLSNGICKTCGSYWPCKATMLHHAKCHKNYEYLSEDPEEVVPEHAPMPESTSMHVFDFAHHVQSPINFLAHEVADDFDWFNWFPSTMSLSILGVFPIAIDLTWAKEWQSAILVVQVRSNNLFSNLLKSVSVSNLSP